MQMDLAASIAVAANAVMLVVLFVRMVRTIGLIRMGYLTTMQKALSLLQIILISAVMAVEMDTISSIMSK